MIRSVTALEDIRKHFECSRDDCVLHRNNALGKNAHEDFPGLPAAAPSLPFSDFFFFFPLSWKVNIRSLEIHKLVDECGEVAGGIDVAERDMS